MVLTRKNYKDLGFAPISPQGEWEPRRKQSKITNYFPHKEGNKNLQHESTPKEIAPIVLDWSIQRKDLQTELERPNYSMSWAQELDLAENALMTISPNPNDLEHQKSTQNLRENQQDPQPTVNTNSIEERGDQLYDQIDQIRTDLYNIKNFLAVTNGLLLTLVENFKQAKRATDQLLDSDARIHIPPKRTHTKEKRNSRRRNLKTSKHQTKRET
ncbi:Hypothetical predicted protein [Podarcis lilfordi]|uniref:Uncharacterized protein n=1 Tax=Podarcis lilfordi TaxID=74358 RepID=A0AA35K2U8_9SAUR|nr:Hypothetical predicted protein [Podarcis lilfordi]